MRSAKKKGKSQRKRDAQSMIDAIETMPPEMGSDDEVSFDAFQQFQRACSNAYPELTPDSVFKACNSAKESDKQAVLEHQTELLCWEDHDVRDLRRQMRQPQGFWPHFTPNAWIPPKIWSITQKTKWRATMRWWGVRYIAKQVQHAAIVLLDLYERVRTPGQRCSCGRVFCPIMTALREGREVYDAHEASKPVVRMLDAIQKDIDKPSKPSEDSEDSKSTGGSEDLEDSKGAEGSEASKSFELTSRGASFATTAENFAEIGIRLEMTADGPRIASSKEELEVAIGKTLGPTWKLDPSTTPVLKVEHADDTPTTQEAIYFLPKSKESPTSKKSPTSEERPTSKKSPKSKANDRVEKAADKADKADDRVEKADSTPAESSPKMLVAVDTVHDPVDPKKETPMYHFDYSKAYSTYVSGDALTTSKVHYLYFTFGGTDAYRKGSDNHVQAIKVGYRKPMFGSSGVVNVPMLELRSNEYTAVNLRLFVAKLTVEIGKRGCFQSVHYSQATLEARRKALACKELGTLNEAISKQGLQPIANFEELYTEIQNDRSSRGERPLGPESLLCEQGLLQSAHGKVHWIHWIHWRTLATH